MHGPIVAWPAWLRDSARRQPSTLYWTASHSTAPSRLTGASAVVPTSPIAMPASRLSAPAPSAALVSGSLRADGDRMEEEGLSHVRAHHASTLRNRSSPLGEVGWIHMRGRLGRRGGRRGLSSSGGFPARVWPPEPSGSPVTSPGKAHDDRIRLSFAGMHGARISELGLGDPSASRGPGSWRS